MTAAFVAPVDLEPPAAAGIYLIHLEPAYLHAGHYLGWSSNIAERIRQHAGGGVKASPLLRAAAAAGSSLDLARVWIGESRAEERRMKNGGGLSRHCPICRGRGRWHR